MTPLDSNSLRRIARIACALWVTASLQGPSAAAPRPNSPVPPSATAEGYLKLDGRRIAAIETWLPETPVGLGPDCNDRKAFDALAGLPANAKAISDAEAIAATPFPAWNDDDYLDFSITGQRPRGQAMIGARRGRLAPLVWAECLENRGRFIAPIEQALREYLAEPCWTWPSHDGKLTNFHRTEYTVDLISATFGAELARALYLLGDRLKPELHEAVRAAVRERVWEPVFAALRDPNAARLWTVQWLEATHNWNAVCLSGVVDSALTALPDRRDRAVLVAASEVYIRNFMDGFTADGYCTEGLGYWNYGFGRFIVLRASLYAGTGGRLDLFTDPKVRAMALFGPRLEVLPGVFPAIADCGFETRASASLLAYCDQTLGLGLGLAVPSRGGLMNRLTETAVYNFGVFPARAGAETAAHATKPGRELRSYFPDAGVLICRPAKGGRLGVALKGGSNDEHHNHNDVGSFTLALGKGQPIGDVGGPRFYNSETFGPLRYTKFEIFRSRNHGVPLPAGREQRPGPKTDAVVLRSDFKPDHDTFTLDLRAAYEVPGMKTLTRTFVFSRKGEGSLEVRDDFAFADASSFETTLTTKGTWKRTGDRTLEFSHRGETVQVNIESPCELEFLEQRIEESEPAFTRVGIKLRNPLRSGTLTMRFTPAAVSRP